MSTAISPDAPTTVIARRPPDDGREWDAQCARCGSSVVHLDCHGCAGEGRVDDEDYDDGLPCTDCGGAGGWQECCSGLEWCEAHPMPTRETTPAGAIEWFVTARHP